MTEFEFYRNFCSRCSGFHVCVQLGSQCLCQPCMEILLNDRETKNTMKKLLKELVVNNAEI